MNIVKKLAMLVAVFSVASCGGSGSKISGDDGDPSIFDRYTVSVPLVDNSTAGAYKVLLMGNSHAAGLAPVLAELLALGQSQAVLFFMPQLIEIGQAALPLGAQSGQFTRFLVLGARQ